MSVVNCGRRHGGGVLAPRKRGGGQYDGCRAGEIAAQHLLAPKRANVGSFSSIWRAEIVLSTSDRRAVI